jgi:glycosyltransferase involved in cell wall biosynthesis
MLSIIIPTLNEEKYLPRLLDSIKSQDFSDYEIIVSDAGSGDLTAEIATRRGCKTTVNSEHRHPSWQRNYGAAIACGEQLLFLDADTVLSPGFLSKTVAEYKARGLECAGFYIRFNPNRRLYSVYAFFNNIFCFLRQRSAASATGAGIIADKKVHDKINGFDTSVLLSEDYDYCYRAAQVGKFRMLKSVKLLYSSRRLEKEGRIRVAFKWLYMGLYCFINRRIRKKIMDYEFGQFKKNY